MSTELLYNLLNRFWRHLGVEMEQLVKSLSPIKDKIISIYFEFSRFQG